MIDLISFLFCGSVVRSGCRRGCRGTPQGNWVVPQHPYSFCNFCFPVPELYRGHVVISDTTSNVDQVEYFVTDSDSSGKAREYGDPLTQEDFDLSIRYLPYITYLWTKFQPHYLVG